MKNLKYYSKGSLTAMLLLSLLIFGACSEDEDDVVNCLPGIEELTSEQIGTYSGLLTLNSTSVVNASGTATLVLTDCKTYSVNFSDNIPSIVNVRFIASQNGTVLTYVNETSTSTVIINADGTLTVSQTAAPVITFTGNK